MLENLKTLVLLSCAVYSILVIGYIFKKPTAIRLSFLGIFIIQTFYLTIFFKNKCTYFWMSSGTAFFYTLGLNLYLFFIPPKGRGFYFLTVTNFFVTYTTWVQLKSNSVSPSTLPPSLVMDLTFYLCQFLVYISLTLTLVQIYLAIEGKELEPSVSIEPFENYRLGKAAAISWLTAIIFNMWWSKNMWGQYFNLSPFDYQFLVTLICQIALLNMVKLKKKWYWNLIIFILVFALVILLTVPVYERFMGHSSYAG